MEQAGLEVVIKSTVDDGAKGIALVNQEAVELSKVIKQLTTQFNDLSKSVPKLGNAATKAAASSRQLSNTVVNANGALAGFNNIIRDAPFGVIGIGNNITQLSDAFAQLRTQTGSVGGALSSLAASIFSPAGLISVGLSSAITLWTVYSQRQQQAASETKKLKEEHKTLNDVLTETAASVQGQIETSRQLGAIVLDLNKSYEQRKAALNELKKTSKDYFGNLSLEKTSYEQIKTAIDRYSESLIRSATIKGLQEQISKTAETIAKQAPVIGKGLKEIAASDDPFAAFVEKQAKDTGTATVQLQGAFTQLDSMINASGRKVAADIGNVGALQQQAVSRIAPLDELKEKLKGLTDALSEALSGTDTPEQGKGLKTISDILKALDTELAAIDAQAQAAGATFKDLGTDKIGAFKKAIEELVKIGIDPGSDVFATLQTQIEEIQKFLAKPVGITQKPTIKIQPVIEALPPTRTAEIQGLDEAFRPQLDALTKQLNAIVESAIETGVVDIAGAFGNALVTGDFGSVAKAFANSIGGFMQDIGKALVATGIGLEAFKNSLKSLNGPVAIVAGVGLIAAGAAFKAIASKGLPSFATGGVVSGPTLAMVGDNPSGIEYMLPKELTDRLAGRAAVGGQLTARLRGDDLLLSVDLTDKNNTRRGGRQYAI